MARAFGTEFSEYLPAAAGAAAVAAVYLGAAYQYSPEARAAPLLIGWTVIVLAALDIVSRTQTPIGRALSGFVNPVTNRPAPRPRRGAPAGRQADHGDRLDRRLRRRLCADRRGARHPALRVCGDPLARRAALCGVPAVGAA